MNKFEIKAKFYELIQTKMMHVPMIPETVLESFAGAFIINNKFFREMFSAEDMYQIISDPQMPRPLRNTEGPADEAMAIIEFIVNEELHYLSQYLIGKLTAILSYDYGGLYFAKAMIEYKNVYSLLGNEPDGEEENPSSDYEVICELVTSEVIDSHLVSGVKVFIIQTPTTKKTFGRVILAGIDFLLMREVAHDQRGRPLSVVSN